MTMQRTVAILLLACCAQVSGKVIGLTIDDESCSGLGPPYHNVSDQLVACAKYFQELQNFTSLAHKAGLKMSADAGTGWACPGEGLPPVAYCFNITYNGKNASVAEHVVDLVDTAVLMDYQTTLEAAHKGAEPYLRYADTIPGKSVVIGLAVASPTQPRQWFETVDETALEKLMQEVAADEAHHESFKGFAVFTSQNWFNNSMAAPYKGSFTGPVNMWYMDREIAYDAVLQQKWLSWAASRKVTGWYISPHGGSRPLIGGNPADEQLFCTLIKNADAVGIHFEFFTSLENAAQKDIPFLRSCE